MKNHKDNNDNPDGVFFSEANGQKSDEYLHDDMLESVASVADEAGIRVLMEALGMTREEARQLVNPKKPS